VDIYRKPEKKEKEKEMVSAYEIADLFPNPSQIYHPDHLHLFHRTGAL
jgi:hypothetical protein